MRDVDMLMAFPYILLALAIVAALGPGLFNALIAVAAVNVPFFARSIRGITVSIAHKEFVDAARLAGMSNARIIVTEVLPNVIPVIIIADEPTTALDLTVQSQILSLFDDLRRSRGLAIVFITHDFGVVALLCDRVAVMYAGRIVEKGRTGDILDHPRHRYTARLMACVPELGGGKRRLEAIPGLPPLVDRLPAGCGFAERCHRAEEKCRQCEIPLSRDGNHAVRCLFPEGPVRKAAE